MNIEDDSKVEKPLKSSTLEQMLIDKPEDYKQIRYNCILAVTGIDKKQRNYAMYRMMEIISKYVGDRKKFYFGSRIEGNTREIVWTIEDAKFWQLITKIPAHYESYEIDDVTIFISKN